MKRLIGITLSIAMFNLQVGTAFAGTMGGTLNTNSDHPDMGKEVNVRNETTKKATEADASAAITISSISLFASGVIAPIYVMNCSTMPSTWIYAGTAGIYLGSEILNWGKYKNASDRIMKAYLGDQESTDKQINALNSAKDQTKEAAKAASRKALFAKIAAAGYSAAAAMALVETFTSWYNGGACPTPSKISPPRPGDALAFNLGHHDAMVASLESGSDTDSYFVFKDYTRFLNGEKSSITLQEYYEGLNHVRAVAPSNFKTAVIAAAIGLKNTVMNDAFAGFGDDKMTKAGIGVGAAAGVLLHMFRGTITTMMSGPALEIAVSGGLRSAVFGASAAIALVASGQIDGAAEKLEKRAMNYEELVKKLEVIGTHQVGLEDDTQTVATETVGIVGDTEKDLTAVRNQDPCFVETKNGKTITDSMCSCKASNTCKKPKIPKVKMKNFNMPKVMTSSLKSLDSTGKSLYSGNYAEAQSNGQALVNNAASVSKFRKEMEDKINNKLKGEGKKALNFRAAEKNWQKAMDKATAKALKSMKPADAKRLLAMANGTSGQSDDQKKVSDNVEKKTGIKLKETSGTGVSGSGSGGSHANANKTADPFSGLNFEMDESQKAELAAAGSQAASEDEAYEYDKNRKQISDNSGKSIFTMISTRYLKSAFPRLFTEEK